MLRRKLYTLGILLVCLLLKQGLFSASAEGVEQFCDTASERNFEHIVACYHLKANEITNQQIANLKLFNKVIDPNRQPDDDLPTINSTQQQQILAPVSHFVNGAENQEAVLEECFKPIVHNLNNVHPQCLLTRMLKQYYDSNQEIITFMGLAANRTQRVLYQSYWQKHTEDILDMMEANVMLYNQMFLSYPIHANILNMQEQAQSIITELEKTAEIIKHIPNKFDNASTTECT